MKYRAMTRRQQQFISEYLVDLNGTQAAIRAGYAAPSAAVAAARLLRDAKVGAEIARRMAERGRRLEISAESVVRQLARIGFADLRRAVRWRGGKVVLVPSDELDDDTAAAIGEVSRSKYGVRIKLADKVRALELLGRHLAIFAEAQQQDAVRYVLLGVAEAADIESWAEQHGKPAAPALAAPEAGE
jgi:phage terminase small subunit